MIHRQSLKIHRTAAISALFSWTPGGSSAGTAYRKRIPDRNLVETANLIPRSNGERPKNFHPVQ